MNEDEEFITRCPSCGTSFRVSSQQMYVAGAVRCGACLRIFQSDEQLVSEATAESVKEAEWVDGDRGSHLSESDQFTETAMQAIDSEEVFEEHSEEESVEELESESDETVSNVSSVETAVKGEIDSEDIERSYWQDWDEYLLTAFAPNVSSQDASREAGLSPETTIEFRAPSNDESQVNGIAIRKPLEEVVDFVSSMELEEHPEELVGELKPDIRLHPFWIVSGIFLLVSGVLQYLWFNKEIYAQQIEYRPYYENLCNHIGCALPEYRNPRVLIAKNLLIRSHTEIEGALLVDALLENSGPYRQEFPDLKLLFKDIENLPVAAKRFTPMDYLAGELRGLRYIPANTEVRFSIEILDPGENALGYSLEVLPRR
jgi:predicted Zn finger-like uncharacterized protein